MDRQRRYVVIGAGIVGTVLAHRLATAGAAVALLDRDRPGRGTSRWSFAWLNSNNKTPRGYHDLTVHGMEAWARLAAVADGGAWYRPVGNLRWAACEDGRRELAGRVARLRDWGYAARVTDRREVARLEPALALPADVAEVAWFPDEGYVLTEPLIDGLIRRTVAAGAELRTAGAGEAVAAARTRDGGWSVTTADGGRVTGDVLVCCAGRWTPGVSGLAGRPVPVVEPESAGSEAPGLAVRVGPVAAPPVRVAHTPLVHLRAHGADTVHLEAADADVDLHTPEAELDRWAGVLLERARHVMPSLATARVLERTVCVRPLPLDGLPAVGPADGAAVDGGPAGGSPYVVVTHSGVTLAAGLAELAGRELLEDVRVPELAPFRPGRFD
ncbi:FAD-binding oxidoreductase [Streptomyces armeniacus]|uniref:FAD-binding oxidoreductase n=1 Tax=Streptomyces armeniacus TaxID=83291 RepID=A0A345XIY4_9ACTN|nr:FAD-binding oxidoreductase [Streptomyces armeniacus]AXK31600.1 FAD-binding oxidoreductase [Streptomyces armeniacus]